MSTSDSQTEQVQQQAGIKNPEGGFRPQEQGFIAEPTYGYTPRNPAYVPISDHFVSWNPGYGHDISEDAFLGSPDYRRVILSESSAPELNYALQNWLYDTTGNRQDLSAYGFDRVDGQLAASVTLLRRSRAGSFNRPNNPDSTANARYNPNSATDGSDSTPKHALLFDVIKGTYIDEATLTGENDSAYVMAELTGMAKRGRVYHIDQPPTDTELCVFITEPNGAGDTSGSNTGDTDLQVVIEGNDYGDGAPTSETVAVNADDATTPVATTTQFGPSTDGIGAIEIQTTEGYTLDSAAAGMRGDCVVAICDDTSTAPPVEGEYLARFYGSVIQGGARANEGVPPIGSGSLPGSISGPNVPSFFAPDTAGIARPPGESIAAGADAIQNFELSVENNSESVQVGGRERAIRPGNRGVELTTAFGGETVTAYLQNVSLTRSELLTQLVVDNPGSGVRGAFDLERAQFPESDTSVEAGEPITEREVTLLPQVAAGGGAAITIQPAMQL